MMGSRNWMLQVAEIYIQKFQIYLFSIVGSLYQGTSPCNELLLVEKPTNLEMICNCNPI